MGNHAQSNSFLLHKIDLALHAGPLNNWEQKFLRDMKQLISRRPHSSSLSPKQYAKLNELVARKVASKKIIRFGDYSKQKKWKPTTNRFAWLRRARRYDRKLFSVAALIVLLTVWKLVSAAMDYVEGTGDTSAVLSNPQFSVTDGDTIKFRSHSKGTRLVGFNTPETNSYFCKGQIALGRRATARLKNIVKTYDTKVVMVPCACQAGTQGTSSCNYGRSCAILYANGVNVGDMLISEGLAARFNCGKNSCPKLPRPWCE